MGWVGMLKSFWGFWMSVQSWRVYGGEYNLESLNLNGEFEYW